MNKFLTYFHKLSHPKYKQKTIVYAANDIITPVTIKKGTKLKVTNNYFSNYTVSVIDDETKWASDCSESDLCLMMK